MPRIHIEKANFSWGFSIKKDANAQKINDEVNDINLEEINLTANDGDLVAITGAVGSGKTTFLNAILEELQLIDGSVSA